MTSQRERRERSDEETYQIDVVVSVFAILLVLLVVLAAASATRDGEGNLEYLAREEGLELFALSSIQQPYRVREFWIVDANWLFRLDLAAAARVLAMREATEVDPYTSGIVRMVHDRREGDPLGTWRLKLSFSQDAPESDLIGETVDLAEPDALETWLARQEPIIVYVGPGGRQWLSRLDRGLRAAQTPFRIIQTFEDRAPVNISRRRENYLHERILRVY